MFKMNMLCYVAMLRVCYYVMLFCFYVMLLYAVMFCYVYVMLRCCVILQQRENRQRRNMLCKQHVMCFYVFLCFTLCFVAVLHYSIESRHRHHTLCKTTQQHTIT